MNTTPRFLICLVWLGAIRLVLSPAAQGQVLETVTIRLSPTVGQGR
jgi:hypothetical protein